MAPTWNKLQPYGDEGMFITVRMQKTQQLIKNPISEEALELIGFYDEDPERKPTDKVFAGLKNVATTQIYPDMADETKRQSVDRITLKPRINPTLKVVNQ